jgi:hypothetical protein
MCTFVHGEPNEEEDYDSTLLRCPDNDGNSRHIPDDVTTHHGISVFLFHLLSVTPFVFVTSSTKIGKNKNRSNTS